MNVDCQQLRTVVGTTEETVTPIACCIQWFRQETLFENNRLQDILTFVQLRWENHGFGRTAAQFLCSRNSGSLNHKSDFGRSRKY